MHGRSIRKMSFLDLEALPPDLRDLPRSCHPRLFHTRPVGRRLRLEGLVSRPDAVGNNRYERYMAAGRFGWAGDFVRLEGQGLIEHAAGFDTADLPYKRPSVPDHQALQSGLYGELNFLGRHSGIHGEVQHTAGTVLWQGKQFKPHGRYRAFGGHLRIFNLTATAEYRRVDPTFIAPQGAYEYRQLYPNDRHRAPDEAVGQLKWFYPFHTNASLNVEVEQGFWTKMKSLDSVANQNRVALALQAQF